MPLTVAPRTLPAVVSTIGEASAANAHRAESPPRSVLAINEPPPISERRSKVRRFTSASRKFPEGSIVLLFMTSLPLVIVLVERSLWTAAQNIARHPRPGNQPLAIAVEAF